MLPSSSPSPSHSTARKEMGLLPSSSPSPSNSTARKEKGLLPSSSPPLDSPFLSLDGSRGIPPSHTGVSSMAKLLKLFRILGVLLALLFVVGQVIIVATLYKSEKPMVINFQKVNIIVDQHAHDTYKNVSSAMIKALPGYLIFVKAGIYDENFEVRRRDIKVVGAGKEIIKIRYNKSQSDGYHTGRATTLGLSSMTKLLKLFRILGVLLALLFVVGQVIIVATLYKSEKPMVINGQKVNIIVDQHAHGPYKNVSSAMIKALLGYLIFVKAGIYDENFEVQERHKDSYCGKRNYKKKI